MSPGGRQGALAARGAGILALALCLAPARGVAADLEAQVKAEFLERFTRFVEWPAAAFPSADAPFVLCQAGENPFGGYLADMARSRKIQGRRLTVRRVAEPRDVDGCHLVFVGPCEARVQDEVLGRARGKPILTVGDPAGFAGRGGLIGFYREGGRVRFEINAAQARRSGLKLSSRLLKLARVVAPGETP